MFQYLDWIIVHDQVHSDPLLPIKDITNNDLLLKQNVVNLIHTFSELWNEDLDL